ncbi:MAG TPA: hypothetical protein VND65_20030 [Candidatus Binatia bacterium]|nr:hypothetical protein [Candidatus Binatia bacterium]
MSVSPVVVVSLPAGTAADGENLRPAEAIPERVPSAESAAAKSARSSAAAVEDEVKVQWETPGEIAVYQFLDQNGAVVLQVPPQQWINLAQQISQELAQEAAAKPETKLSAPGTRS